MFEWRPCDYFLSSFNFNHISCFSAWWGYTSNVVNAKLRNPKKLFFDGEKELNIEWRLKRSLIYFSKTPTFLARRVNELPFRLLMSSRHHLMSFALKLSPKRLSEFINQRTVPHLRSTLAAQLFIRNQSHHCLIWYKLMFRNLTRFISNHFPQRW